MPPKVTKTFYIDKEHAQMFAEIANQDRRSHVETLKILIENEYQRRQNEKVGGILIGDIFGDIPKQEQDNE